MAETIGICLVIMEWKRGQCLHLTGRLKGSMCHGSQLKNPSHENKSSEEPTVTGEAVGARIVAVGVAGVVGSGQTIGLVATVGEATSSCGGFDENWSSRALEVTGEEVGARTVAVGVAEVVVACAAVSEG